MLRATRRSITWMAAGVLLVVPAPALSADGGGQDIPITDPVLLERLGFEPDATNVYATPQALDELLMDPAERAAIQQARLEEYRTNYESSSAGGPYGTSAFGHTPVSAHAIRPRFSTTVHQLSAGTERYCVSGPPVFDAYFDALPHGGRLPFVGVWYYDDSDENLVVSLLRVCQPDLDSGGAQTTLLGTFASSGAPGNGFALFGDLEDIEDIDLESCAYYASIQLGSGTSSCTAGADLAIQKVRAIWLRQVSPAPTTATFDDVPTGHPFFQHIEALAASEITSGCGGNNFCPNAPLTRGQMAVFLATALGLHWGSF